MSFEYQEQYKYLTSACLNLTDACNLACRYCFVEQHPHFMTIDIAKDAVDFLVNNLRIKKEKNYQAQDQVHITFFGGEPMLLWDEIIVPLVEYAYKTYPNEINFSMTTNGTLLNKERIDFLADNKIPILLSIDGAKKTQDYNRPCQNSKLSSFDMVYQSIPYILEKFPNTTFRATIDQHSVENTFENYLFAHYMGFKNIFIMPNGREVWSEEAKAILKDEFEKIYWFMANSFCNNIQPINCGPINDSFTRVLTHDIEILKPQNKKTKLNISRSPSRCGMGTSFGSIGYDGRIYGCQEQNSKDLKNIFFIGDIYNGISEERHSALLEKYTAQYEATCINKELCKTCKLKNICTGFACPSSSWDLFQEFSIDNEIHCIWAQILFDNATVLMHYFKEHNNDLFQNYLYNNCKFNIHFPKKKEG